MKSASKDETQPNLPSKFFLNTSLPSVAGAGEVDPRPGPVGELERPWEDELV